MTEINKAVDKENVSHLIKRLLKECQSSSGYIGVEFDDLTPDESSPTLVYTLFNKINDELNVLEGNSHEYIKDDEEDDLPFRNERNLKQHMVRLGKFVKKYAPKYLSQEDAEEVINQTKQYVNI